MSMLPDHLDVINTFLNGATIITFVSYFWLQNQKGNIITRRENTTTLGLKDEIISELRQAARDKDEVIKEQSHQLTVALENAQTLRQLIEAGKSKAGTSDGHI